MLYIYGQVYLITFLFCYFSNTIFTSSQKKNHLHFAFKFFSLPQPWTSLILVLEILEVFRPALLHWRFQLSHVHEIPEITVERFGQSHPFSQLPVMRCSRSRPGEALRLSSLHWNYLWVSDSLPTCGCSSVCALKRAKWRPPTPVINTVPAARLPWHDRFTRRRHVEDMMTLVLSRIALLLTPAVTCDSKTHGDSASLASTTFCSMDSFPNGESTKNI